MAEYFSSTLDYRRSFTEDDLRPRAKQLRYTPNKFYELLEDILKQFECPICHEYMVKNIVECNTGHSFCKDCARKSGGICSICNDKIQNVRNFALENAAACVERRCKWAKDGCTESHIKLPQWKDHIEDCEYSDYICPLMAESSCEWKGKLKDIKEHLFLDHNLRLNVINAYKDCLGNESNHYYYVSIVTYFKKLFKLHEIHRIKGLSKVHTITWVMKYIGGRSYAEDYEFVVKFFEQNNCGNELTGCASCIPYQQSVTGSKSHITVDTKDLVNFRLYLDRYKYTVKVRMKNVEDEEESSSIEYVDK